VDTRTTDYLSSIRLVVPENLVVPPENLVALFPSEDIACWKKDIAR